MHSKTAFTALSLMLLCLVGSTGCYSTTYGPTLGILWHPIPISPYFQKELEDHAWEHERYDRMAVLPPIPPGAPETALDPPSDDEVMRTLEDARPVSGGLPYGHTVQRNNVRIVKDLIADYMDPPRNYPTIGPARLHHVHYKCTVYFTETTRVGWPVPYTTVDEDVQEVVYIDHDHLHLVGNVDGGPGGNY